MQFCSDEFSSSCSSQNPGWACSINFSRGPLASFRPGQPPQKCSSHPPPCLNYMSYMIFLPQECRHTCQSQSAMGLLPLSGWPAEICALSLLFSVCMYPSAEHALLQNYYFQLVMVTMCLNVAWHYWNSLETPMKSVYFRVDIVQKQYCLLHNRSSILGEWLFFKLRRMTECIPILTRAGYEYNILSE